MKIISGIIYIYRNNLALVIYRLELTKVLV